MGTLGRVLAMADPAVPSPFSDFWYQDYPAWAGGGIRLSGDAALKISAVWRGVNLLASTIAGLPLPVYQRVQINGQDGRVRADNHPLAEILDGQPNDWQTSFEYREMKIGHLLLRGDFFAEKVPWDRPGIMQLIPRNPDKMKVEMIRRGRGMVRRYEYTEPDGTKRRILADDMHHVMGFSLDGVRGVSFLTYARETLGTALAMQRHQASLFSRGVRTSGALTYPKVLSEKGRSNLRKAIDELHVGPSNVGRPLLLEEGMQWQQMGMTQADAEFAASSRLSVADIARYLGTPLHKLMELERSTNNNIEQQALEWVVEGVLPWCKRDEQAIRRDLIAAKGTYYAEYVLQGLLRGDTLTRFRAYALGRQWGWLSPNDIRRLENLNPIPGGDRYDTPLNMGPITAEDLMADILGDGSGTPLQMATSTPLQLSGPSSQLRLLASDNAARVIRKEVAAVTRLRAKTEGDDAAWAAGLEEFYADHASWVADTMRIPIHEARRYVAEQLATLRADGPDAMADWETTRASALADLSAGQGVSATGNGHGPPIHIHLNVPVPATG